MSKKSSEKEFEGRVREESLGPALEMENVTKSYQSNGRNLDILRDVSLRAEPGEQIAVIGPSGAGKSTLLHIAGTLLRPTSGTVKIQGQVVADQSDGEISRCRNKLIGFIFQFHHLHPDLTALENVLMPLKIGGEMSDQLGKATARTLLERVGLADRMDHVPGELSGGEQQRVAVARALVQRPALVLADEPTGDLDRENGEKVFHLLKMVCAERQSALIVVTHEAEVGRQCHRTIRMVDGQIEKS